jgi:ribosomal protein L32E
MDGKSPGSIDERLLQLVEVTENQILAADAAAQVLTDARAQLIRDQQSYAARLVEQQDRQLQQFGRDVTRLYKPLMDDVRQQQLDASKLRREFEALSSSIQYEWRRTMVRTAVASIATVVLVSAMVGFASLWWQKRELEGLYRMRVSEAAAIEAQRLTEQQRRQGQRASTAR